MSTFTALNGGSPRSAEPPTVALSKTGASDERPRSAGPAQPQAGPEVSSSHRPTQSVDRLPYQSPSYPDVDGSHKRKRSESLDQRRGPAQDRSPEINTGHSQSDPRDAYGTPQRDYRHFGDEQRDKDSWYAQGRDERSYESQQNSATSTQGQTEEQIGEALRRAAGHMDHGDYSNGSPDEDDNSMSLYGGQYTPEQRRDGVLQHDAKKRKRNFSNRTKTGCLTCRKRKKKCDEQKPEC